MVYDYCGFIDCDLDRDGWTLNARVCLCYNDEVIRNEDDLIPKELPRCCEGTNLVNFDFSEEHSKSYDCPLDTQTRR
jgi:hypothetical protein